MKATRRRDTKQATWAAALRRAFPPALLLAATREAGAQLSSGTSYRGDGYSVVQFTSGSGNWTVPDGITNVELLVVGGGGSAGLQTGGGGGGGVYSTVSYAVTPGSNVTIEVGVGGPIGGSAGSNSVFDSVIAYGGNPGTDTAGGDSGGNNQGDSGFAGGSEKGGGGGSGEAGANAWFASAKGGDGRVSTITGVSTNYGGGGSAFYNGAKGGKGGGGSTADSTPRGNPNGADGFGGGGAAARDVAEDAGTGGAGVVIVAYHASDRLVTTTILSTSTNPSAQGDPVMFSATVLTNGVTAAGAGGTFVFAVDGANVATQTVADGMATYLTSELAPGIHEILATYSGDAVSGFSFASLSQTNLAHTATELVSSSNPSTNRQIVVFTATVQTNGAAAAGATGTLAFTLDGLEAARVAVAGGSASYSNGTLSLGSHVIEAVYSGDTGYLPSQASLIQTNGSEAVLAEPMRLQRADNCTIAVFTNTDGGTWTVPAGVTNLEVLLVGGGGGGGLHTGGGGGGGFYFTRDYAVTPGAEILLTVGAGGPAGGAYEVPGNPGCDSIFGDLTAYGGSGGNVSAGGGSGGNKQGGTGFDGGATQGGGGGAGEAGAAGWFNSAKGGDGLTNEITGTNQFYGGGGSAFYNGAQGGRGGGGSTIDATPPGDAKGVDGLGGGGAAGRTAESDAGAGGLGAVILAYLAPPEPPTNLVALAADGQVSLSWTAPFGASGYLVMTSNSTDNSVTTNETVAALFAKTGLANGTTYYFWAVATNRAGASANSETVAATPALLTPPPTPMGFTAWPGDTRIDLSWSPSTGATGYRIVVSNSADSSVATDTVSATSLAVTNLSNGGTYFFRVAATNEWGDSLYSAVVSAIPLPTITPTYSFRADGYTLATFRSGSGLWQAPSRVVFVEVLVVGGGGGGSANTGFGGQGGGGGGVWYASRYLLTGGSIPVTVGAGGAFVTPSNAGKTGGNSIFGSIVAYGGVGPQSGAGQSGGAQGNSTDGLSTIVGKAGGSGAGCNGGGGASAVGGSGGYGGYSTGGDGVTNSISGRAVCYAGGGGGSYAGVAPYLNYGGAGGGGQGSTDGGQPASAGINGLGGGGGGGRDAEAGAGGDGIVIVAYKPIYPGIVIICR